jgi:hypothetical protein
MDTVDQWFLEQLFLSVPSDIRSLNSTCKRFNKLIKTHPILNQISTYGWNNMLCAHTVNNGNYKCFQFCVNHKMLPIEPNDQILLIQETINKGLDFVTYLNDHSWIIKRCYLMSDLHYSSPISRLNFHGQLDICQYMVDNHLIQPRLVVDTSIRFGDIDCLQLVCQKYYHITPNDQELINISIYHKQPKCMKFLHEQGLSIDDQLFGVFSCATNPKCWFYGCCHRPRILLTTLSPIIILIVCLLAMLAVFFLVYIICSANYS